MEAAIVLTDIICDTNIRQVLHMACYCPILHDIELKMRYIFSCTNIFSCMILGLSKYKSFIVIDER
jgi:hypothetical protein